MSEIDASGSVLAHMPPEWRQPHDLNCPGCSYNLRGLRDKRCPECGRQFVWNRLLALRCSRCGRSLADVTDANCPECNLPLRWQEMIDGATTNHTKLFEYSGRPVRAALRACWRLLWPWRFWREIPIELPTVERRLRAFRNWAAIIVIAGMLSEIVVHHVWYQLPLRWMRIEAKELIFGLFTVTFQPLFTFFGVRQFRLTLRQFEIRREHYQRCQAFGMFVLIASAAGTLTQLLLAVSIPFLLRFAMGWFAFSNFYEAEDPMDQWRNLGEMTRFLIELASKPPSLPIESKIALWLTSSLMALRMLVSLAVIPLQIWFWLYAYTALKQYLQLGRGNAWALVVSTQLIAYLLIILLPLLINLGLSELLT